VKPTSGSVGPEPTMGEWTRPVIKYSAYDSKPTNSCLLVPASFSRIGLRFTTMADSKFHAALLRLYRALPAVILGSLFTALYTGMEIRIFREPSLIFP
jgi:hypothetical protein